MIRTLSSVPRRARLVAGPALVALVALVASVHPAGAAVPCQWEPSFGGMILSGDDSTTTVPLGMTFPFLGTNYTSAFLSTNGFMTFGPGAAGAGSGCCDADTAQFLAGPPRVSVAWADQVTTIFQNNFPGRAVFTWEGTEFSGTNPHRWQVQLRDDGRVTMGWDLLPPDPGPGGHRHHGLIGVTNGQGIADPGERDLSSPTPFTTSCIGTMYEFFARGPNGATGPDLDPWDMESNALVLVPDGCGGWSVTSCLAPPPVEDCDDGIDNDGDGDVDCNDSDCPPCAGPCDLSPIEAKLDDETRFTSDAELATIEAKLDTDSRWVDEAELAASRDAQTAILAAFLAAIEAKLDARLDAALSSRASQASVDALEVKLDALTGFDQTLCDIVRLLHTPDGRREADCGGEHYEWNGDHGH